MITKKGGRWEVIRLDKFKRDSWAYIQIADFNADDINAGMAVELKRVKPSTVNRELNLPHSVMEVARKEWKWATGNPVKDVKRPRDQCSN